MTSDAGLTVRQGAFAAPSFLPELERIMRLRDALWTAKGEPKPLIYQVVPMPLPFSRSAELSPVGSYLCAGGPDVRGLNQQPSAQPLKLEWWKAQPASVGLELEGARRTLQQFGVTRSESGWNLFRLLGDASWGAGRRASWTISSNLHTPVEVTFRFDEDPLHLFAFQTEVNDEAAPHAP